MAEKAGARTSTATNPVATKHFGGRNPRTPSIFYKATYLCIGPIVVTIRMRSATIIADVPQYLRVHNKRIM